MYEGLSRIPFPDPDPDREVRRLREEINRIFSEMYGGRFDYGLPTHQPFALHADIYENESEMVVEVDLPGLEADDFELTLIGHELTLRGARRLGVQDRENIYLLKECGHGPFARSFKLPSFVMAESASAEFRNGVLRITLSKNKEVKARRIEIKAEPVIYDRAPVEDLEDAEQDDKLIGLIEEMFGHGETLNASESGSAESVDPAVAWGDAAANPLYINVWIEDADRRRLMEPYQVAARSLYEFLFSIEPWSRSENGTPFEEPDALKDALKGLETTEIELEVACPLLDENGRAGYTRRKVTYHAGFGFEPISFSLKPKTEGHYFLSVCLLLGLEPLYSDTLPIEVVTLPGAENEAAKDEESELIPTGEER
jgi:HSP20 family protein